MTNSVTSLKELQELFETYKKRIIVLVFFSNFCIPCRKAKPKIKELMKSTCPKTLFVLIEVKDDPDIMEILEKYQIYTIPKFIILEGGKQVFVTNDPEKLEEKLMNLQIRKKTKKKSLNKF
jgi:thiol-disulfide isomerase/thioredoxin